MEINKMSRADKVVLFVIHGINGLVDHGIMKGKYFKITEQGEKSVNELISSGFKPTDEEINSVIDYLIDEGILETRGGTA